MQKTVYEFISQQTNDPIVEWRTCAISGDEFALFQGDIDLLEQLSPVIWWTTYTLPLPNENWQERQKALMIRRNERSLYKWVSALTWDPLISLYAPSSPYKVYTTKEWRSDAWDAKDYATQVDVERSFIEQLQELRILVPHMALINDDVSINSLYVNQTAHMKNCYLTFNADNAESCRYGWMAKFSKYCVDSIRFFECENCYEIIDCRGCYEVQTCHWLPWLQEEYYAGTL